jgi:hypothetical protein
MVQFWFRLGSETPIKSRIADRSEIARRNPQDQIVVAGTGFEQKNTTRRIGGQSGGQRTPCRTRADDDRVPLAFVHRVLRSQ